MAASTRPLTLGEILDRTVQIYRRNFLLMAGTAAPPAALIGIVSGAVLLLFTSQVVNIAQLGQAGTSTAATPTTEQMAVIGLAVVLFLLIGIPLMLGVFAMGQAALNYAASQINRGESVAMRSSYGYAFRHFWRHVGILFLQSLFAGFIPYCVFGALIVVGAILAGLLAKSGAGAAFAPLFGILIVIGAIAMIVVCVLIWLRLSLAYPASIAEDQKAWPSLKRSNFLTKGTRGRIFVMFLLVFVLTIAISLILTVPIDIVVAIFTQKSTTPGQPPMKFLFLTQLVNLAIGFLVRIFVMPIYTVALVLFYTDQRTRLEGYDIEQLMTQAGWSELPPPAFAAVSEPVAMVPADPIWPVGPVEQGDQAIPPEPPAFPANPEGTEGLEA